MHSNREHVHEVMASVSCILSRRALIRLAMFCGTITVGWNVLVVVVVEEEEEEEDEEDEEEFVLVKSGTTLVWSLFCLLLFDIIGVVLL